MKKCAYCKIDLRDCESVIIKRAIMPPGKPNRLKKVGLCCIACSGKHTTDIDEWRDSDLWECLFCRRNPEHDDCDWRYDGLTWNHFHNPPEQWYSAIKLWKPKGVNTQRKRKVKKKGLL